MKKMSEYCEDCVFAHIKYGKNYEWLQDLGHGKVVNVWFREEKIGGDNWILYDRKWWKTHCKAVSHGEDLIDSHIKAFVNKRTRFAELLFAFEDGSLIAPTREFYELEYNYFKQHKYCQ